MVDPALISILDLSLLAMVLVNVIVVDHSLDPFM